MVTGNARFKFPVHGDTAWVIRVVIAFHQLPMRSSASGSNSPDLPPVSTDGDDLLDAEQLGRFFGLGTTKPSSARAAINMRIRRKHPMPPSMTVPGLSGRRWLKSSVVKWLKGYEKSDVSATSQANVQAAATATAVVVPCRRRGRPTKEETIARRASTAATFDSPPAFERR